MRYGARRTRGRASSRHGMLILKSPHAYSTSITSRVLSISTTKGSDNLVVSLGLVRFRYVLARLRQMLEGELLKDGGRSQLPSGEGPQDRLAAGI